MHRCIAKMVSINLFYYLFILIFLLCDSIYIKYPEWVNQERQKADGCLPGTGGKEKCRATACLMCMALPLGLMKIFRSR